MISCVFANTGMQKVSQTIGVLTFREDRPGGGYRRQRGGRKKGGEKEKKVGRKEKHNFHLGLRKNIKNGTK